MNLIDIVNKFKEHLKPGEIKNRFLQSPLKTASALTLIVTLVTLIFYTVHLNTVILRKFDGKRWSIPAVVYARPLELFSGRALTADQLEMELLLAGYREESEIKDPGGYERSGDIIRLVSRDFHFADGLEVSLPLIVTFADDRISRIERIDSGETVSLARLDPARIGSFHPRRHEDRILVIKKELPLMLIRTLIAVEDKKFVKHFGIDPLAILRAAFINFRAGDTIQGGSTLTQQLVKNFFLSNEQTIWRKFNEAVMALLLEAHYSKDEILTAYANEIFLGQDGGRAVHGFALASQFYFHKNLRDLKPDQIAVLIGLVKGPSYYDPRRHPERCLKRRSIILKVMRQEKIITEEQYRQAMAAKLLDTGRVMSGFNRYPAFLDLVRRHLGRDYRQEDLTSDGLKIFTTLDPIVQTQVEQKLAATLEEFEQKAESTELEGAVIVSSRENGEILALAGGRKPQDSGFNRALDAKRPVGSLIKPAVFLTALKKGYTLSTPLEDMPITPPRDDGWTPDNFDHKHHGRVSMLEALVFSYNLATIKAGLDVGVEGVIQTVKMLGAEEDFVPYPSFLLGAVSMSPLEVAQIYQTFASEGFYVPQRAINSVMGPDNRLLKRYGLSIEQRFDPQYIFLINTALQKVVSRGTGASLSHYLPASLLAAGKTGTSDDLRDSWFAGFTGDHLAVVWLGADDNRSIGLTGSSGALKVWGRVMAGLDTQPLDLREPPGLEWARVYFNEYGKDSRFSGRSELLPFVKGTVPTGAYKVLSPSLPAEKHRRPNLLERLRKWFPW